MIKLKLTDEVREAMMPTELPKTTLVFNKKGYIVAKFIHRYNNRLSPTGGRKQKR